jgi:carbon-monoxide dehydrogenase medium subunit
MKLWNHYHTPHTIDEALQLLNDYAGQAHIVAGGTDLLVDARAEIAHQPYEALIDITCIPELGDIREEGDTVYIGAGVTHSTIVKSQVIADTATCLIESCGVVGGPQVRNVATLGGNVVHALPAGDGTTSLVALDAEVEVFYEGQRKWLPICDVFLGPGRSLLEVGRDLLLGFRFKKCGQGEATAFKRIMRPQGVALPIMGCAVWVKLDAALSTYESARISIAPVGPKPMLANEVEVELIGKAANRDTIESAAAFAQTVLHPRTSKYRATEDYRSEMITVLLRRTLTLATERAKTGTAVPEGVGI